MIKIYCRAHPLDNEGGAQARGLVHRRTFQEHHVDVSQVGGGFLDESGPVVGWNEPALGRVDADADNEPLSDRGGALSDVEMPIRKGVKRAWEQCDHCASSACGDEASASRGAFAPS